MASHAETPPIDSQPEQSQAGILQGFAKMERELMGMPTWEAVSYIRRSRCHFEKVTYGKLSIPAPDPLNRALLVWSLQRDVRARLSFPLFGL